MLIAGKYRVVRVIGEGGMGVVVEAYHLQLDQRVAIKFLRGTQAQDTRNVARFQREARAAAKVKSDYVAQIYDIGVMSDGARYLVMEYLDGWDLGRELDKHGKLEIGPSCCVAIQILDAVGRAHEAGIVHRDLKPENLFLVPQTDGTRRVKVVDFGISKLQDSNASLKLTGTSDLMGTPLYMSPEQMATPEAVDGRADLWSLGCVLYEMLTGSVPFSGRSIPEICMLVMGHTPEHPSDIEPDVPRELGDIVMKCLQREPSDRYGSAAELSDRLETFLMGPSGPSRSWTPGRVTGITRVGSEPVPSVVPTTRSIPIGGLPKPAVDGLLAVSGATVRAGSVPKDLTEAAGEFPFPKRRSRAPWVVFAMALLAAVAFVTLQGDRGLSRASNTQAQADRAAVEDALSQRVEPPSGAHEVDARHSKPQAPNEGKRAAPAVDNTAEQPATLAGAMRPDPFPQPRVKQPVQLPLAPRPTPKAEPAGASAKEVAPETQEKKRKSLTAPYDEFAEFGGRR